MGDYTFNNNLVDLEYFRLLNLILKNGKIKKNRTGVDTIGVFGEQAKFNIYLEAFPILTTKKVWFKGILHELLWFIKGDTNIKYLVDNDVHIWDEWAYAKYKKVSDAHKSKHLSDIPGYEDYKDSHWEDISQNEFIRRIKEVHHFSERWGDLGDGTYGGMWRAFPYHDGSEDPNHVDQLKKVIDKLKTNPDDRRLIVSAWHPYWVDHCALPPCHVMFHFNTEELTETERILIWQAQTGKSRYSDFSVDSLNNIPKRKLNCLLYQRSCDTFLGVPFNITSYCLLTAMIAHCVNMVPGTFTHTYGDLHIYTNHLEQVKTQLSRETKNLPSLWINPEKKNLFNIQYEDVKLINYEPHPAIKGEVAV
jgi:thymidylate synthase